MSKIVCFLHDHRFAAKDPAVESSEKLPSTQHGAVICE